MAKAGTLILSALGIGALIYFGRKAHGGKKLEFYPQSVDLSKISFTNWKPNLIVNVVNPSYAKQSIDAVFLNVYFGDTQLGRIQISQPFEIPKLTDLNLSVPINVFPAAAGKLIGQIATGAKPRFTIKGSIMSMGISIPIEAQLN